MKELYEGEEVEEKVYIEKEKDIGIDSKDPTF